MNLPLAIKEVARTRKTCIACDSLSCQTERTWAERRKNTPKSKMMPFIRRDTGFRAPIPYHLNSEVRTPQIENLRYSKNGNPLLDPSPRKNLKFSRWLTRTDLAAAVPISKSPTGETNGGRHEIHQINRHARREDEGIGTSDGSFLPRSPRKP